MEGRETNSNTSLNILGEYTLPHIFVFTTSLFMDQKDFIQTIQVTHNREKRIIFFFFQVVKTNHSYLLFKHLIFGAGVFKKVPCVQNMHFYQ